MIELNLSNCVDKKKEARRIRGKKYIKEWEFIIAKIKKLKKAKRMVGSEKMYHTKLERALEEYIRSNSYTYGETIIEHPNECNFLRFRGLGKGSAETLYPILKDLGYKPRELYRPKRKFKKGECRACKGKGWVMRVIK